MVFVSPIPETEPPHDCPRCPRLVALREELRTEHPAWWNAPVPAFGDPDAWLAIVGPAGLSKANVSALQSKIQATLQERDVQEHLAGQGVVVAATGADAAVPFFRSELDKHARIVRQAGATLN